MESDSVSEYDNEQQRYTYAAVSKKIQVIRTFIVLKIYGNHPHSGAYYYILEYHLRDTCFMLCVSCWKVSEHHLRFWSYLSTSILLLFCENAHYYSMKKKRKVSIQFLVKHKIANFSSLLLLFLLFFSQIAMTTNTKNGALNFFL